MMNVEGHRFTVTVKVRLESIHGQLAERVDWAPMAGDVRIRVVVVAARGKADREKPDDVDVLLMWRSEGLSAPMPGIRE